MHTCTHTHTHYTHTHTHIHSCLRAEVGTVHADREIGICCTTFCIPLIDILAYEKISVNENFCVLPVVRMKNGSARDMTPFILVTSYRRTKRKLL